jgi:AraC-like DNA-binding protein
MTNTVINTSTKSLLRVFEKRGYNADDILSGIVIKPESLFAPQGRLEIAQASEIWRRVYEQTDETIGLEAAVALPNGAYGVLDYLLLASATLGDFFAFLSRYYPLINSGAQICVHFHLDLVYIELCHPPETPPELLKRSAEYTFAVFLQRFRLAAEKRDLKPFRIDFAHALPQDVSLYQKIFQTNIQFNQKANRIVFERELLKLPMPQADVGLAEMLKHYADELLSKVPMEDDLIETVRQVLRFRLRRGGNVNLNSTARELAMSARDLQRKLNSGGTSYQDVLDKLRCELALDYLSQNINLREIAHLLGFSESSAFLRAFKSWTGKTPREIKRNGNTTTY